MERRASVRRPIHLKALLAVGERALQPCVISDFCAEGLFIQYGVTVAKAIAEQMAEATEQTALVCFSDATSPSEHRLRVRIVRTIPGAMGVSFAEPNTAALSSLLELCAADEPRSPASPAQSESVSLLLRQCIRTLQHYLRPLSEQLLTELLPALTQAAESAPNDGARTAYLDAEALIRTQASRLFALFMQELAAPLIAPDRKAENGGVSTPAIDELSLIEKTEFEDWLMLKVMITKAETQYRAELLLLKMRLDKVGVVSRMGYQNPLGPPLICYAFRDAMLPLRLPQASEKFCYRLFEKVVMKQLDELYQELNRVLTRHGVLPDLDLSKYLAQKTGNGHAAAEKPDKRTAKIPEAPPAVLEHRPPVRIRPLSPRSLVSGDTAVKAQMDDAGAAMKHAAPKGGEDSRLLADSAAQARSQLQYAQSAFSTVCNLFNLLDRVKQQAGREQLSAGTAPVWSYDEMQRSLAQVQEQRRQNPASVRNASLRRQLETNLRRNTGLKKELPRDHREPLDVIDQFFHSLMKNPWLSETAKEQVKRLELPVFKLLLRDHRLFDKKNSPILAVINRIAELNTAGGRPSPVQNERITRMVSRICEEFDQDASVVDEVMAELDDMLERQNLLFRRNVERVTAAAEGSQKVEDSKRVVAREIGRRISGRSVPRAIVSLINGGWRDLLSLAYIRQGPDSSAWQNYLSVLDILLTVGENPHHEYNLSELLGVIKEGLASISSSHMPSGHIHDELKSFLMRLPGTSVETVEMPQESEDQPNPDVRMLNEIRKRGQQRWLARAQKLRAGDWLKLERAGELPQQIRLAWIGKGFSRFVFVNHQGMKVIDLDSFKLAAYLQRGILVPESGQGLPIVDQSLDAMVKDVYDQLSYVTTHDEVTQLVNRKEFERNLAAALTGAGAEARFSLIYLDLRQFKIINDTAGYEAGDQVLADIADLLRKSAPDTALLARMGGNEFGVLLEQGDGELLAQRYLTVIHDYRLHWQNRSYSLAAAIGVVDMAGSNTDADRCLKTAEQACRRAKAEGMNRLRCLTAERASSQQEQILAKVASLGSDLKSERILLRCQKVIPLHAETRVGTQYQILLSIYDDRGHLIPAYDFVRMAERYNRMQAVDRWVVGHMLDWMAQNRAKIEMMGSISINLSGHSLNDEELLEFIFERLTQTDSPIDKVCFEVTEAAAIANIHDVAEFMQELREYGCRFCLGNFGTGMSSYQFLKTLPVDLIKIDGSFIKNLAQDSEDQMMVRSMAEMVHFMGKELIATQVESKACLDLLPALNVDYAQGYCIEKPRLLTSF